MAVPRQLHAPFSRSVESRLERTRMRTRCVVRLDCRFHGSRGNSQGETLEPSHVQSLQRWLRQKEKHNTIRFSLGKTGTGQRGTRRLPWTSSPPDNGGLSLSY